MAIPQMHQNTGNQICCIQIFLWGGGEPQTPCLLLCPTNIFDHQPPLTVALWCVPQFSDARLPSQKPRISQLSCGISLTHAPFLSSSFGILSVVMTLSTKWMRPWRDLFSLYLYHVGPFIVDFKCPYTPDHIATLFWSPIYTLYGLAVRAIQCQVV